MVLFNYLGFLSACKTADPERQSGGLLQKKQVSVDLHKNETKNVPGKVPKNWVN